jgi:hypothetical protein
MPRAEAEALAEKVAAAPYKYKADTLGSRLRLTDTERTALHITTIRAVNVSAVEMAARRKQRDRERKRVARLRRRVTTPEPASRSRPWQVSGISRATWYRRRKVQDTESETKSVRSRVLSIAADAFCLTVPTVRLERYPSAGVTPRPDTIRDWNGDRLSTLVDLNRE